VGLRCGKAALYTIVDDLADTLSRIETVFGRLEYLAFFRSADPGGYRHAGLASVHGESSNAKPLQQAHVTVFREWLSLPLAQKKIDLERFCRETPRTAAELRSGFRRRGRDYIPRTARAAEAALFLAEIEVLREIVLEAE
jgi:hypothetical protein